jgi:hypothetical protein
VGRSRGKMNARQTRVRPISDFIPYIIKYSTQKDSSPEQPFNAGSTYLNTCFVPNAES